MSIIHTFDGTSPEIISPQNAVERVEGFPETVIAVFSDKFTERLASRCEMEQISCMVAGDVLPVYRFRYKGHELGLYRTLLGGAASGALLEEIIAKGGRHVLYFGSCGSLDRTVTRGKIVVPTAAYRDEGTSYHYAPPGDYMDVKTAGRLAAIFDGLGVPYFRTRTWTTDAFYRETRANMEARRREGCSVVEMECASVMAVGDFRGIDVYQFLYTADCLDGAEWDAGLLGNMTEDLLDTLLRIALETAIRIA